MRHSVLVVTNAGTYSGSYASYNLASAALDVFVRNAVERGEIVRNQSIASQPERG